MAEENIEQKLRDDALEYHRKPVPGKIALMPTKGLSNQRDLSLAYSPGVAYACTAIQEDPQEAASLTARANLVAVVTNGTAVLGLGNIGALAGKPVMEGKACLFKKFAGIDVFDIEIGETDPDKLIEIVAGLELTFGGINLEDIKAPECFYIERKLRERMKIPVFHDDQHGTAIVVSAAILNGLMVVGKDIKRVKLVASGAGAAALACLDLIVQLGLPIENITVTDLAGVVYKGRKELMDPNKERYAKETEARTLAQVMSGADVFLGLSAGGVLKPEMVKEMAEKPLIFALANPEPEIRPELAKKVRPDAICGTGRSDYPNQVNNSLCFPFIFRGALDCGATTINEEMKVATVRALAEIARAEPSELVAIAYGQQTPSFGPDYLIPRAFDPRLIAKIAPAVARAAMESGVAARPIADFDAYQRQLGRFVYQSGTTMEPVFEAARKTPKRVIYAEGEDERVLRAVQVALDEGLAKPILIGRPEVIEKRNQELGLRIKPGDNCELVNPGSDPRYHDVYHEYHRLAARKGVTLQYARDETRNNTTLIAAILTRRGDADAMLCGVTGPYQSHLKYIADVIGLRPGVENFAAMNMLMLPNRTLFICDTYINPDPTVEQISDMTALAALAVRRFGLTPRVALLSHSSFGAVDSPSARKMRDAFALITRRMPELEIEGEMQGNAALCKDILDRMLPDSRLKGEANLLIMPNLDAANIAYTLLEMAAGGGITVGPILLGAAMPAHILTPTASVRRIVNMTALAAVDAASQREDVPGLG